MSAGKSSPNQQSKRADLEVPDGISLEAELAALVPADPLALSSAPEASHVHL